MRRSRSGFQGKRQFQNSAVIKYIGITLRYMHG